GGPARFTFQSRQHPGIVPRGQAGVDAGLHNNLLRSMTVRAVRRHVVTSSLRTVAVPRGQKNAAGWPREYSQTPSDEGNKQL
ncbi:MAG: hypothetical protein ACJ8J3_23365, partial [Burkholderia ambifaria]